LVAIDADTTQERLNEIATENHIDLDTTITAAEDAAIIREALARLTPDQRTALVMWEMEGRTTEEIATALNTTPANVRHILGRARKSMVRVLEEWIVDEKTGLTALNALSNTYKKSIEIAQKSSKAALSLVLVITAFLGFNSMTGNESPLAPGVAQVETSTPAEVTPSESAAPSASASATAKAAATAAAKKAKQDAIYAKIAALSFIGLNKEGIPTAFSITDENGNAGVGRVTKGISTLGTTGLLVSNQFITGSAGPNVLIDQLITVDGTGTNYSANSINVGFGGNWRSVEITSTDTSVDRLANGNFLVTATFRIGYLNTSTFVTPTGKRGYDLVDAPKTVTTRVLLSSGKTQVLAQAVQVTNK
jgi:DNA-binding CsgD family transcriptional regulator